MSDQRVGVQTVANPVRLAAHARAEHLVRELRAILGNTRAWSALEDAALTAMLEAKLRIPAPPKSEEAKR